MGRLSILAVLAAAAITGYAVGFYVQPAPTQVAGMKAQAGAPAVPAVTGYSEGQEILFIHTETSDPKIAKLLTDMMGGSPVLHVPSLAKVPAGSLSRVYVYKNGVKPEGPKGPLGYQADVFESPPGKEGYTPLRRVYLVTWKDEKAARLQKSAKEIQEALGKKEISIEDSGKVVNMPFLAWPGGRR